MMQDRPEEGATMLQTFILLLFYTREYKKKGLRASDPVISTPMSWHLGEGEENIEV